MRRVDLQSIAATPVSHDPEILKRVMIANGEIPHLTTFSQASFAPGQRTTLHEHPDMWEVYFVTSGRGTMRINGKTYDLSPGVCITVEPGDTHEVVGGDNDTLILTYFGIEEGPS